jgi:hypothetical protein
MKQYELTENQWLSSDGSENWDHRKTYITKSGETNNHR